MRSSTLFAVMASISAAAAVSQGFNYGSTNPDGSYKDQATYTAEFTTAQNLVGTSGFTSARLYTMIVSGPAHYPWISLLPDTH
jgi:glucan endo-1,3-beta-D-glucosidase